MRIAAVSYLNTIPFIYGIEHSGECLSAGLLLSPPADCAKAMKEGRADVALIPVAEIPKIENIEIVGSHCIGAVDAVRTVVLLSDTPVTNITKICLDPHSRTSVALIKILSRELWSIAPVWEAIEDYSDVTPAKGVGYLLIGDKVFGYEDKFRYKYDLALEWRRLTGLPFVFAAWVARKGLDIGRLDNALEYGVKHIDEAVDEYAQVDRQTAVSYLKNNISFTFDSDKHKALELFWVKIKENGI